MTGKKPRTSVIVPVFNEERTLEAVIDRVRATGAVDEIVAVDDGSSDRSPQILAALATSGVPHVTVVRHEKNLGKGAAVRTGFARVTGDVVVVQDADLELDPAEFPTLFAPIVEGRADVVFGIRFAKGRGATPWAGYIGNKGFSILASVLFLRRLNDVLTCYRAMRTDVARRIEPRSTGFGMDAEQGCRAIRDGFRIAQVPVTYTPRTKGEGKKLRFSASFAVLAAILSVRFGG
jgi:glycosyltransferase involved in cell wall biosynthesis